MRDGTDADRRQHHRELILGFLREQFPDSKVHAVSSHPDEVMSVQQAKPHALYRLHVGGEILEDARDDQEIVAALQDQCVVEKLRENVGELVLLRYDLRGEIVAVF